MIKLAKRIVAMDHYSQAIEKTKISFGVSVADNGIHIV